MRSPLQNHKKREIEKMSLQIHDERILERYLKDQSISEENRKSLNEFNAFLKAVQKKNMILTHPLRNRFLVMSAFGSPTRG